jgi:hypothetical protein
MSQGKRAVLRLVVVTALAAAGASAQALVSTEFPKPYSPPCVERENVFEFTEKPQVKSLGEDRYEISFAVKGKCDATVGIVDRNGVVVRHLASGVLGANAPVPFQKDSLKQAIVWNGKNDLGSYEKKIAELRVRVQLGLNPVFDKQLGGKSPYLMPGQPFGLAAAESGIYVLSAGPGAGSKVFVRKFDHDGKYVESLVPPPSRLPESRLQGLCWIEYEKGKRALHAHKLYESLGGWGNQFLNGDLSGAGLQPTVIGDKLYYANTGFDGLSFLHYMFTDGGVDLPGIKGMVLQPGGGNGVGVKYPHLFPHLAASPDGRYIYYASGDIGQWRVTTGFNAVWRKDLQAPDRPVEPFAGRPDEPGSDAAHLSGVSGVACDAEGRVYAADTRNSRVQIFAPDGKFLATIPVDRPLVVAVHQKTGAIYVLHTPLLKGRTERRLTKFAAFDKPAPVYSVPEFGSYMAVDSWAPQPRIWLSGAGDNALAAMDALTERDREIETDRRFDASTAHTRMLEERGNELVTVLEFGKRVVEEDGPLGQLLPFDGGALGRKLFCDPVREQVYVARSGKFVGDNLVYDLKTGKPVRSVVFPGGGFGTGELAFDKKGYLHSHFTHFYTPGVARFDPEQAIPYEKAPKNSPVSVVQLKEALYNYGMPSKDLAGILPVREQPGGKWFQDGLGVNMAGDIAEQANIYFMPKVEEAGNNWSGTLALRSYAAFLREVQEKARQGEETYFLKRGPGLPACGPTIWTFAASGQLLQECAVIMSSLIEGAHIDEDRRLYFVSNAARAVNGTRFLNGRLGRYGDPGYKVGDLNFLVTGVLVKSGPKGAKIQLLNAPVPLDTRPERAPEIFPDGAGDTQPAWIDGAEWIYAGASPLVTMAAICSCPKLGFHLDWFKRSYVPEAYRHSVGILDTNGNLILHLGRFGNFDDGAQMGRGGDIIVTYNRYISGTDNYLVYDDNGERVVVLKLNYHAEAEVPLAP